MDRKAKLRAELQAIYQKEQDEEKRIAAEKYNAEYDACKGHEYILCQSEVPNWHTYRRVLEITQIRDRCGECRILEEVRIHLRSTPWADNEKYTGDIGASITQYKLKRPDRGFIQNYEPTTKEIFEKAKAHAQAQIDLAKTYFNG